jgi:hypothetical protein
MSSLTTPRSMALFASGQMFHRRSPRRRTKLFYPATALFERSILFSLYPLMINALSSAFSIGTISPEFG